MKNMISGFDVQKVAHLARIQITSEEEKMLFPEIQALLGYVQEIMAVPVDDVLPLYQPFVESGLLREDVALVFDENLVSCSEQSLYDAYQVPPMQS
jgi:aspartyl-tRNA(Asn)/glutamyl-tRNA(Gln) amidotransferase subunit C